MAEERAAIPITAQISHRDFVEAGVMSVPMGLLVQACAAWLRGGERIVRCASVAGAGIPGVLGLFAFKQDCGAGCDLVDRSRAIRGMRCLTVARVGVGAIARASPIEQLS